MEDNDKLFKHPDLEIRKPDRITVKGFVISWILVLAIIGLTVFLAGLGR
jgi:hypothetical protein